MDIRLNSQVLLTEGWVTTTSLAFWQLPSPFGAALEFRVDWPMYTVIYLFPVPEAKRDAFLRVQREAGEIYRGYGALADETLEPRELEAAYGCAGFEDAIGLRADEALYLGLSHFRDRAHHDEVMAKVDADTRIGDLYNEMVTVLEMPRVVRGAFAGID